MAGGFSPDGLQPLAGGECVKQFVSRVRGVGHNLSWKVLEVCQIAANHLLCSANHMMQFSLVLGSVSSIPDGDGGGEDGLSGGSVEVHHQ